MIALDLIASIFARPGWGSVAPNVRRITPEQLKYLQDLIAADPEATAVRKGAPGSLVWAPAGNHKYVITEDLNGTRHTLTKLSSLDAEGTGSLF